MSGRQNMKLITNGELAQKDQRDLDHLFKNAFGGLRFKDTPKADLRAVICKDQAIVAHVGIQNRLIDLPSCGPMTMVFVGQVVVHQKERGCKLGLTLIHGLIKRDPRPFILNCGEGLIAYYEKIGFYVASNAALYDRNNIEVVDDDPVMIHNNGGLDQNIYCDQPIPLGRDF